jgi:succinate dehydrogenase / fumarate reductase, cytochrome b subunit
MSRLSRVTLSQALGYRGGQPMLAWLLHRITGLGIILFVAMHVFAGFFVYATTGGVTNAIANALTALYESTPVQLVVLFSVLYHALNGLRIAILDMWPGLHRFHREAMWMQWALFLPLWLLPSFLIVTTAVTTK